MFHALAKANGFQAKDLLANEKVEAGPLKCCRIEQLPREWSWLPERKGYLHPKLRESKTVRAHSSLSVADDAKGGGDEDTLACCKRAAPAMPSEDASSPQCRRVRKAPKHLQDYDMSAVGSPESEAAGCTQPVPIYLHRAAFVACSADPEAASKLEMRHICGNPKCGVVSHFRGGTKEENDADKKHHAEHGKGTTWASFPTPCM